MRPCFSPSALEPWAEPFSSLGALSASNPPHQNSDLIAICLQLLRTLIFSDFFMARPPLTFRPTAVQRQWLVRQCDERGIPLTTVIQLALEVAMARAPQVPRPKAAK